MEITINRNRLLWAAVLAILAMAAAAFLYFNGGSLVEKAISLFTKPAAQVNENQPAMKALAAIYAPVGDRTTWEQEACLNMTARGCELFKAYYAPAIWKSGVRGTDTKLVRVADSLEDGSQVWQTGTTINGNAQPLFIQVEKRGDGNWVLERILFEEEAKKYEK